MVLDHYELKRRKKSKISTVDLQWQFRTMKNPKQRTKSMPIQSSIHLRDWRSVQWALDERLSLSLGRNEVYIWWWMKTNWPLSNLHLSELLPKEHNTGLLNQLVHYKCNCSNETKMTEHTTNQVYEKPKFDGNLFDGDIVRRIQADSFREVWVWTSSKLA